MIQHEAMEQEALFEWAAYNVGKYPELRLLYHIPNGGRRDPKEAAFLKRQGVKAGVPDLCLPVARKGYHGLYIELKYGRNKPTQDQRRWLSELSKQGYCVVTCYGWEQAKTWIEGYLDYKDEATLLRKVQQVERRQEHDDLRSNGRRL